jgi:hypothetical protein
MSQNTPDLPSATPAESFAPQAAVKPKAAAARTAIGWVALVVLLLVLAPLVLVKFTDPGRKLWLQATGAEAREREASQALKNLGAIVVSGPDGYTSSVNLVGKKVDQSVLQNIAALCELDNLDVANTNITDDDLWCVAGLTRLSNLMLTRTAVTGAGFVHLRKLNGLAGLNLADTPVDDDGLAHLVGLQELRVLTLTNTRVTDAGMKHVAALKGLQWLLMSDTAVSDAGLEQLAQVEGLRRLSIAKTQVTSAGLKKLQAAIPELTVDGPGGAQDGPR